MKVYGESDIRKFIKDNFDIWNDQDRQAFTALYREASPNGLHIEYVGQPEISDGWAAFDHMWENYNQDVKATLNEVLVNGNEGVCYVHNNSAKDGVAHPTIEIYKFENGKLSIRYFHNAEGLVE